MLEQGFRYSTVEGPHRQKVRKQKNRTLGYSASEATLARTQKLGTTDLTRYNSAHSFHRENDFAVTNFSPANTDRSSHGLLTYMVNSKNVNYVNTYPPLNATASRPRTAPLVVIGDIKTPVKKSKSKKSKGMSSSQSAKALHDAASEVKMDLLFLEHPDYKLYKKKYNGTKLTLKPQEIIPASARITQVYKRPQPISTTPVKNGHYLQNLNVSPKHKHISADEINLKEFVIDGTWGKQTMWENMRQGKGPHPKPKTKARLEKLYNDMPDRCKSEKWRKQEAPLPEYSKIARHVKDTNPKNIKYFEKIATPQGEKKEKFDAKKHDEMLRNQWGERDVVTPDNIENLIKLAEIDKERWKGTKYVPDELKKRQSLWK